MMEKKEYQTLVSGLCFAAVLIIVLVAIIYAMGREEGIIRGHYEARSTISTGQPPIGTPVLLFWTRDDGTVYAVSAIKTDYAGILPFSTTASAVPHELYSDFDYWTVLDNTFAGVKP